MVCPIDGHTDCDLKMRKFKADCLITVPITCNKDRPTSSRFHKTDGNSSFLRLLDKSCVMKPHSYHVHSLYQLSLEISWITRRHC